MKSTDAAAIASELVADSGHGSRQFARRGEYRTTPEELSAGPSLELVSVSGQVVIDPF